MRDKWNNASRVLNTNEVPNYFMNTANTRPFGSITIDGNAEVGGALRIQTADVFDAQGIREFLGYTWRVDGEIVGRVGSASAGDHNLSLFLKKEYAGKSATVTYEYIDGAGNREAIESAVFKIKDVENTVAEGAPRIVGSFNVGETLTADVSSVRDDDGLRRADFKYQWYRDGVAIENATGTKYKLSETDLGAEITVDVSFTDRVGNFERVSSEASHVVDIGKVIRSDVSFELPDNGFTSEVVLIGSEDIDATGNDLNNKITGNSGSNILDGGAGADTMTGGRGNDTYYVDDKGDRIVEVADLSSQKGSGGNDIVYSEVSINLSKGGGRYVENIVLTGGSSSEAAGNFLDNRILGNGGGNTIFGNGGSDTIDGKRGNDVIDGGDGHDIIIGGVGVDVLTGGDGEDTFVFTSASQARVSREGTDIIADFISGEDVIDLSSVDGNARARGYQELVFIEDEEFSGVAGELRFADSYLSADTNGDGKADFVVEIQDVYFLETQDILI